MNYNYYTGAFPKNSYKSDPLVEYGIGTNSNVGQSFTNTPYSLTPMARYFTGTNCAVLGIDQAPTSQSLTAECPAYDLTIRSVVALHPITINTKSISTSLTVDSRIMDSGTTLEIWRTSPFYVAKTAVGGSIIIHAKSRRLNAQSNITSQDFTVDTINPIAYITPPIGSYLDSIDIQNNTRGIGNSAVITIDPLSYQPLTGFAIDKGFTSVISTGYFGNAQKRLMLNIFIYNDINLVSHQINYFRETSQSYDQYGCLINANPDASVCTP